MNKLNNILIVGGIHGDEPTGIDLVRYINKNRVEGLSCIIGNPVALKKKVRFLETDLNRSFHSLLPVSQEEQIAKKIKKNLYNYDLIIDFHNTKASGTTCAIVTTTPNNLHRQIALHFGFDKIVQMPPSGSLISVYPENSLSLEISYDQIGQYSIKYLIDKIKTILKILPETKKLPTEYRYLNTVTWVTLDKLKIKHNNIINFKKFTINQKKVLKIPTKLDCVPIFFKEDKYENTAFTLLCKK